MLLVGLSQRVHRQATPCGVDGVGASGVPQERARADGIAERWCGRADPLHLRCPALLVEAQRNTPCTL